MKRLTYILGLAILLFAACKDNWKEHYDEGNSTVSSQSVLEYLKSNHDYDKFVAALEATGVAEELQRDQNLTVWAVNNEAMDQLAELEKMFTDTFIMQYQINNLSFGYSKLYDGLRLRSLNGKYISVSLGTDDAYVADAKILKTDQFCKNGVVHEINHLMEPVIGIYDYLLALGDNYSTIVDTIFNSNDTVFDVENSVPIGVDITGNTIYDSVFVIENPLLAQADFKSEFSQLTMFLPDNSVIDDCLENYKDQLLSIGMPCTLKDTILAFNWIKGALFYDGIMRNIDPNTDLVSAVTMPEPDGRNIVWRTSVQQLDMDPKMMSNGIIYNVTKMKIPNNIFITRIKSLVQYIQYVPEEEKPNYIQYFNETSHTIVQGDSFDFTSYGYPKGYYFYLKALGDINDSLPLAVEFSPLKIETLPDNTTVASEMLIPAGEYKFYFGFRSKNHAYVNFYFNGELVGEEVKVNQSSPWNYDRVTETVVSKYDGLGGLVNIVNVAGEGLQHVKIKVEFSRLGGGSTEELQLYHWALKPTENNY
ncbi:fasciclin domain-containing protein [Saccharicrinis sp. FJH54]|uniref:fasciclin domain-containing protein n=1 Tax=Saccharicrinis sp. FJH54 TaxID=3344665 RepID=UPI0035D47B51